MKGVGTKVKSLSISLVLCSLSAMSYGSEKSSYAKDEILARLEITDELTPYTTEILGDRVDQYTGSLSFYNTDVSIPGNNGLDVSFGRVYKGADLYWRHWGELGDWSINVPSITTVIAKSQTLDTFSLYKDSCDFWWDDHPAYAWGKTFDVDEYRQPPMLNTPGGQSRKLLVNRSSSLTLPDEIQISDSGSGSVDFVTSDKWIGTCLDNTTSGGYDGFLLIAPNGYRYYFNKHTVKAAPPVIKDFKPLERSLVAAVATRVEDPWGNYVDYNYVSGKLDSIVSSDGRRIDIEYVDGKVDSVTAGAKTWTYEYDETDALSEVYLPDGRFWEYSLNDISNTEPDNSIAGSNSLRDGGKNSAEGWVKHPSGVVGTFKLRETTLGRTDVPKIPFQHPYYLIEPWMDVMALVEKSLDGPGLPPLGSSDAYRWTFDYQEDEGNFIDGENIGNLRTTTVSNPDGSSDIYYFNRKFNWREGATEKIENLDANGNVSSISEFDFEKGLIYGASILRGTNAETDIYYRRTKSEKITRNSDEFSKTYSLFNGYDSPEKVDYVTDLKDGTSYSKSETIVYKNYLNEWIIDSVKSVSTDEVEKFNRIFCANNQNGCLKYKPEKWQQFGVTQESYEYDPSTFGSQVGTYDSIADANNNILSLSDFKRGIPQTINRPGTSSAEALIVNSDGSIKEITDPLGHRTQYGYDAVGRLNSKVFPLENDVPYWNDVSITYSSVGSQDLGHSALELESGQLKQVIEKGAFRQTNYYDGLYRLVAKKVEDTGDSEATTFQKFYYDYEGKKTFESYVGDSDDSLTSGVETEYDILGRVKAKKVLNAGVVASTVETDYLSSFRSRVTDAKKNVTVYHYKSYGDPDNGKVVRIDAPESITTKIDRDVFGNILTVTQSGTNADGPVSYTQTYRYDNRYQLCEKTLPEIGTTAYYYDAGGNLKWEKSNASGLCGTSTPPSGAIIYKYNKRNFLESITYPDETDAVSKHYDDNDNLKWAARGDVRWDYQYDSMGNLSSELLDVNGRTFSIAYGFDRNAALDRITYPTGRSIELMPDAMGRPTQVGDFAEYISYWPSGAVSGYSLPNGHQYSMIESIERLPEYMVVPDVLDLQYVYDKNHNVHYIHDHLNGNKDIDLTHDGVDRLTSATGIWGNSSFTYDSIGNIETKNIGAEQLTLHYDTSNRLESVSGSQNWAFSYDDLGNVTENGRDSLRYNLASLLKSVPNKGIDFKYDAHERRVLKEDSGSSKYSVYSKSGQLMHRFDEASQQYSDYIYLGGKLLAKLEGAGNLPPQSLVMPSSTYGPNSTYKTSYRISWDAFPAFDRYVLEESHEGESDKWVPVYDGADTYADLSDKDRGHYRYRLLACVGNDCTESPYVGHFFVIPPPGPVSSVTATKESSHGEFSLKWNTSELTTFFQVKRSIDGASYQTVEDNYPSNSKFISIKAGDYRYQVMACNPAGCSVPVESKLLEVTDKPQLVSVSGVLYGLGYEFDWSDEVNATSYQFAYRKSGGSWATVADLTESKYYLDFNEDIDYQVKVRACDSGWGCTEFDMGSWFEVKLPPPSADVIEVDAAGSPDTVSISWFQVDVNAPEKFKVIEEVRNSQGAWEKTAWKMEVAFKSVSPGEQYAVTRSGLTDGKEYRYGVATCNVSCNHYSYSNSYTVDMTPPVPDSITVPSIAPSGSFLVSWSAADRANYYKLYQRYEEGNWTLVDGNIDGESTGVSVNSAGNYQYRVKACNASGCSGYQASSDVHVSGPTGVDFVSVPTSDTDSSFAISWSLTSGAGVSSFQIREEVKDAQGQWNATGWSDTKAFINKTPPVLDYTLSRSGVAEGTYRYGVQSCSTNLCSAYSYSNAVNVVLKPTMPGSISVPSTDYNGSYSISWSASSRATKYMLQERKNSGSWGTLSSSITGTSFPRSGRRNGNYEYRVKACNAFGCSSPKKSGVVQVILPPARPARPSGPTKNYDGSYTISWSKPSGTVTSYTLQEKKSGGTWRTIYTGSGRSKGRTGRVTTTYYYRVKACNVAGCSPYSSYRKVVVGIPNITASFDPSVLVSAGTTTLNWSAKNADYCSGSYIGSSAAASGSVNVYASSSMSTTVRCYFGGQSVSESPSVIVKYGSGGGGPGL